jgi:hypothetical protein
MTKVFVVTTVVKQQRGSKEVALAVYTDKEQAEQRAIDSMSEEQGLLSSFLAWRKKEGYEDRKGYEIAKIVEGNVTKWGKWYEGIDWHNGGGFTVAAKVEEVELK